MSPSAARTSHRSLPRSFLVKNGLPIELRRFPGDCPNFRASENGTVPFNAAADAGQPLIDMYLAFQPRNSFQGLPPIKDEVCVRWVREILVTGIHLVAARSAGDRAADCPNFRASGDCPDFRASENGTVPLTPAQPIIGHAALFPVNARKCEMLVVVCPDFQNVGIGTELVRSCIDLAAELGFEQIWLPVDATNVRARHVYRKCGFEYVSTKQGREVDMTCDVRSARSATIHDLHGPAPRVPAPCFSFPELPHFVVGE
jgi:GNAT superfamily N-acetyltransferase